MRMRNAAGLGVLAFSVVLGCGGARPQAREQAPAWLARERLGAMGTTDAEVLGHWALSEMLAPGGSAEQARVARKRLDKATRPGMWAWLARAVLDEAHGDPKHAADAYVAALRATRDSGAPQAPIVGWFAVGHLLGLRASVTDLYMAHRAALESVLARPGHAGWRAVAELEDWRASEVYDRAERTGEAYDAEMVRRMGCAHGVRIAGPFGHGGALDHRRAFPSENPGPWPAAWAADPWRGSVPRVLSVTQTRCLAVSDDGAQDGVFYAETFFSTRGDRELVVAVQGAIEVWVDDTPVLERPLNEWGSWQRFGAHIVVPDGRHRVLAKVLTPAASFRILSPDGTAAGVHTDSDDRAPYSLEPPRVLDDPNPLEPMVHEAAQGDASWVASPVDAALAAFDAHAEQLDDVASTLIAPLVEPEDAGPLALQMASVFTAGDPALPEDARGPRSRAMRERALARDAGLWRPRLMLVLDDAEQHGLAQAVEPLRKLADDVPDEPEVLEQLATLYRRLGWRGEQMRALADLASRFPDDVRALHAYLQALDEDGPAAEADKVAARIRRLDPDAEVDLDRALARHDYASALADLEALKRRHPERKEIAARIADVLARSGDPSAAAKEMEGALSRHTLDAQARLRVADRAFAAGDAGALRHALASALQSGGGEAGSSGARTHDLRSAIDLVEGATDLEPYRIDGRAVIGQFEAWERSGHHMDGTAARVLDYAATWVHEDGSSEMLEHEIQKIQSQEAVNSESEIEPPSGRVLHLRVIKKDGRILEPERVEGKATLTLPQLEVGDYVEMEHVTTESSGDPKGRRYRSPIWFFREADKGYWRSEFVMITPADRSVQIETRGAVPPPAVRSIGSGAFVERRWRVDLSPPAAVEPQSPPITEFLPSVRAGWGVSLEATIAPLVDLAADETPLDPRLRARALDVVRGTPASAVDERARLVYRWVLRHVQDGKETDGRRVVTGGSGSRQSAFRYLLRLLGIDTQLALVKDRLSAPPLGPLSEVEQYDALVLRLPTDHGVRWMLVRDKFAPYGYVPAGLLGQPAVVLTQDMPRDVVRASAPGDAADEANYEGRATLHENGSAAIDLTLTFGGARAIAWRNALDQIAQAKLADFVEREVVAPSFAGGHVRDLHVDNAGVLDQALVMHVRIEVPEMAKAVAGGLRLRAPFAPRLAELASLPQRHTPLLRRQSWRSTLRLQVALPDGSLLPSALPKGQASDADARVLVRDSIVGRTLVFDRVIDLPAGRVEPGEPYAKWRTFTRAADTLLDRDVFIGAAASKNLGGSSKR